VFTTDGANRFGITAVTLTGAGRGYTGTATITVTTATAVTAASTGNSGLTATNTFTVASVTGIALGMIIAGGSTGNNGKVTAINGTRITSSVNNLGTWNNAANLTFTDYGTDAKFITTLTSTTQNALNVTAYIPAKNGGASAKLSDIVKQEASHRYLVKNTDGIGQCKLVASNTPSAGEMNLIATDANGSTYWVTKLTARRCILTQRTMSTAYLFATNGSAGWTIASASTGVVSIASV
jgi:hypothetical protein